MDSTTVGHPSTLVRAPLTGADEYTPAPAGTVADAWDYEAVRDAEDGSPVAAAWRALQAQLRADASTRDRQRHAAETRWDGVAGRIQGGRRQEAVRLRTGDVVDTSHLTLAGARRAGRAA